jgi:hypothetical protein
LGGGLRGAGQSERSSEGKNDYPFEESNLDLPTRSLVTLLTELFLKMYLVKLQKILFLYHQFAE